MKNKDQKNEQTNPLEIASDQIDQRLVEATAKKIEDIVENIPDILTRMYEEDFVRKFLPLFYYDPKNILNREWLEISGSMTLGVVLVDRDDNEVYRVPPFMPSVLPTEDMQDLPLGQMSGNIKIALDNGKGYLAMNDIYEVVDKLSENTKLVDHDTQWKKFYERYNSMIKIEDADGNNLLEIPKKSKAASNQYLDF